MTRTPEQEHIQRLIDAYIKAPELLALRLEHVFTAYEDSNVAEALHDDIAFEVAAMVGNGMPELYGRVADVILEVARNQMMKENNERKEPDESV